MAHDCLITQQVKAAQERLFRVACDPRRHGLTLTAISDLSGIPYGTLRSYAGHSGETAIMPITRLWELAAVLPCDLLFSICAPGFHLRADSAIDLDDMAEGCAEFNGAYTRARHPNSPDGVNIAPCEREELNAHAVKLQVAK